MALQPAESTEAAPPKFERVDTLFIRAERTGRYVSLLSSFRFEISQENRGEMANLRLTYCLTKLHLI